MRYVGMTKKAALKAIKDDGLEVHIGREDGVYFMRIQNLRRTRVNLEIDAGIVTNAYLG